MKAVALTHYLPVEDVNAFLDVDLPKPAAAGRDLLVAVQAVSINPVDTKVRSPKDKVEDPPASLAGMPAELSRPSARRSRCSSPAMKSITPATLPARVPMRNSSWSMSALSDSSRRASVLPKPQRCR
jgi:hypothetical protein